MPYKIIEQPTEERMAEDLTTEEAKGYTLVDFWYRKKWYGALLHCEPTPEPLPKPKQQLYLLNEHRPDGYMSVVLAPSKWQAAEYGYDIIHSINQVGGPTAFLVSSMECDKTFPLFVQDVAELDRKYKQHPEKILEAKI